MLHPADDSATAWRHLADQLTPDQVSSLGRCERRFTAGGIMDHPRASETLMGIARDYASVNLADAAYADVEVPPGAEVDAGGWMRNLDQPGFSRFLVWQTITTNVDDVAIDVDGRQQTDGSYTQKITMWAENPKLNADQARALSAALIEAADALERLQ